MAWIKSNVSKLWYIKQYTPLGIHYSTWSKHGGKWCDRSLEKHCQFSFSWMNTTTQTLACVAWRFCRAGRTSGEAARKIKVAPAPISSRFLCSRPPLLLSAPNQNRHATQATQTRSLELKTILKVITEEKQQLVQEKDANNVRKVLCKSFLHWFWELNLWFYKCRVDCFGSFRLFDLLLLLKWKSRNMTKNLMSGPSGNQLVLFSLES